MVRLLQCNVNVFRLFQWSLNIRKSFQITANNTCFYRLSSMRNIQTNTISNDLSDDLNKQILKSQRVNDSISSQSIPEKGERLSKYIASTGMCSRREAETWIKSGRVMVNGVVCTTVSHCLPYIDKTAESTPFLSVMIDGMPIKSGFSLTLPKLWAVYKQRGELVAEIDSVKKRPLLFERVKPYIQEENTVEKGYDDLSSNIKPITRLDFNTEGLCLLTNNGVLARILNHEDSNIIREYRIRVHGLISDQKIAGLKKGVFVDGKRQKPMNLSIERTSSTISWLKISTTEISNRMIYKCLKQIHLDVTRIICTAFGPYKVDLVSNTMGTIPIKLTPELSKYFIQEQINLSKGIIRKPKVKSSTKSTLPQKSKLQKNSSDNMPSTTSIVSKEEAKKSKTSKYKVDAKVLKIKKIKTNKKLAKSSQRLKSLTNIRIQRKSKF